MASILLFLILCVIAPGLAVAVAVCYAMFWLWVLIASR
jgi:hypothetical protein